MEYIVKSSILGFDAITSVQIQRIDELFATLNATKADEDISFSLVKPALLRSYEFEIPNAIKALLEISDHSELEIYCIMMIQTPLDHSTINFLAPLVFNKDVGKMAQVILEAANYPHYGLAEPLNTFVQQESE